MFSQQENDLLSSEVIFLKTCFGSVEVVDHVTFLKLTFERLEHFGFDRPVLVATNAARDLSLLDTNVRDHRNLSVIAAQIAERRPFLVVLAQRTDGQNQKYDEDFKQ